MKMPIDTSAIRFVSAGAPEPVLDYETRTQKVDMNGKPLFNVHLFGITETSRDSISVKVPGELDGFGGRVITGVARDEVDGRYTPLALAVPAQLVVEFDIDWAGAYPGQLL